MTSENLVYLIALPLFSSALLMLLGRKADKWGHIFATLISAGACRNQRCKNMPPLISFSTK